MNKIKVSLVAVGAILGLGVAASSSVFAGSVYRGDASQATVASSETIDGSAYLAGNNVTVSGIVDGDVYCAADTIVIEGTVNGDVLCAGSSLTIDGTVNGNVRLAGASVNIVGVISGNATVFGSDVTIAADSTIGGDLTGGASILRINGTIGRDMTAGAATLILNGSVTRDVMTGVSAVTFGDTATIGGNLSYGSDKELSIPDGVVAGDTTFTRVENNSDTGMHRMMPFFGLLVVVALGFLALIGAIVMPRQVHAAGAISWGKFGVSIVAGLTFIIVAPIVAGIVAITGAGVFISYALVLIWLVVMALAPVTFVYFVGTKAYGARAPQVLVRTTIGAALVMFLLLVPVVNVIVFLVMIASGVGMMVLRVPALYEDSPYQVPVEKKRK